MTTTRKKGKQSLPYLLSTTKTLVRCKRYYYTDWDFTYNSKRNRDCFTEKYVRINMTRMWHDIIIPHAIMCRMYGAPTTFAEAIDALNYAMTSGKTGRSLAMWHKVVNEENNGRGVGVIDKYRRSFLFYVKGQAINRSTGLPYSLPKDKVFTVNSYVTAKIGKYVGSVARRWQWKCPWDDLNQLVYNWEHYRDEWDKRSSERIDRMDKLEDIMSSNNDWLYSKARKKEALEEYERLEKECEDDPRPEFPETVRAISKEFHVSHTSAQRFKVWLKQFHETDSKNYWARKPGWRRPKSYVAPVDDDDGLLDIEAIKKKIRDENKPVEPEDEPFDIADDEIEAVDDNAIDKAVRDAENRGDRPVPLDDDGVLGL